MTQGGCAGPTLFSSVLAMWTSRPAWAILLTVVAMLAASFSATGAFVVPDAHPLAQVVVAGLLPTSIGLLIVLGWRRLLRKPWSGVALALNRSTIPWLLLGITAGVIPILIAAAGSVAVGAGSWGSLQTGGASPWVLAVVLLCQLLLLQAFPEELLWRGHLTDLLASRLRPRTVLILTSVCFGALHLISMGGQQTVVDHAMYVVMATGIGFACGAARLATGSTWTAVGVHLGFHLGHTFAPVEPRIYPVMLGLQAAMLGLAGLALLAGARLRRLRRPVATSDRSAPGDPGTK